MKKKQLNELHNKTVEELKKELTDAQSVLSTNLFEKGSNKLKNTAQLKTMRKNIARIKTLLHMKKEVAAHGK